MLPGFYKTDYSIYHPNTSFYKETVFFCIYNIHIYTLPPTPIKEYKYTFVQCLILLESSALHPALYKFIYPVIIHFFSFSKKSTFYEKCAGKKSIDGMKTLKKLSLRKKNKKKILINCS